MPRAQTGVTLIVIKPQVSSHQLTLQILLLLVPRSIKIIKLTIGLSGVTRSYLTIALDNQLHMVSISGFIRFMDLLVVFMLRSLQNLSQITLYTGSQAISGSTTHLNTP